MSTTIVAVGDAREGGSIRRALDGAVADAAAHLAERPTVRWVGTEDLAVEGGAKAELEGAAGVWVAPGSPYRSLEGALAAIGWARAHDVPLLGTCGGFQHVVIELARDLLGIADADHAESSPHAPHLAVTPLVCSLAGQELEVRLVHGTRAAEAYDRPTTVETYSCSYGLNPDYLEPLVDAGLVVSGRDDEDQVRIVELPRLRFFVATLFVPQLSSTPEAPHPLVRAYVEAVAGVA